MIRSPIIVSALRTPIGCFNGALSEVPVPQLGAIVLRALIEETKIPTDAIDEVLMGCVLPAGVGQAPARQAAQLAGLPDSVPCTTINKVCGSGMKSLMLAHDLICVGSGDCTMAGGMESMTRAPVLVSKQEAATKRDHLFFDGLTDAYGGELMGIYGQSIAERFEISRQQMDEYAIRSLIYAQQATKEGKFRDEIVTIPSLEAIENMQLTEDELPQKAKPQKIPQLSPVFGDRITAANASAISDGAAALLLLSEKQVTRQNLVPLARIVTHATYAGKPNEFPLAPIQAIERVLKKANWSKDDIDLFEINEAFAVVVILAIQQLGLDPDRVNVHGGACALGHPIGASGARIVVTLVHALKQRGLQKGVAAICIGGGEATAVAIEML